MSSPSATRNYELETHLRDLLPTDDDVAFYQEHGYFVSPVVLSDDSLDEAMASALRFYAGERDSVLPISSGFSNWTPESGDIVRNNEFVSLQSRGLSELVRQPIVGAIAARLAGTPSIRLFDDQLIYKPGGDRGSDTVVGWHTDHAYWGTCSSNAMLTAWVPFHDVDTHRGPLVVIDGSHRWPELEHTRFFAEKDLATFETQQRARGRDVSVVPMQLRKGQVSFHNCWTLHASSPNRTEHPRVALAIHLQDDGNHYQECFDATGAEIHVANELLSRKLPDGRPNFSDPNVFPTLWSEQE